MKQNIQNLNHIITSYTGYIDYIYGKNKAAHNRTLPEFYFTLLHGLSHLDIYAVFIEQTTHYLPIHEMDMILYLLNSLPKELLILASTDSKIRNLLKQLMNYLFFIRDILIQKIKEDDRKNFHNTLTTAIESLNNSLIDALSEIKETRFIQKKLSQPFESVIIIKESENKQPKNKEPENPHQIMMALIGATLQSKNFSNTPEDKEKLAKLYEQAKEFFAEPKDEKELAAQFNSKESLLEALIFLYAIYHYPNHAIFYHLIKKIQAQFIDKNAFATICLKDFANMIGKKSIGLIHSDAPFIMTLQLLEILDESSEADEILKKIQASDWQSKKFSPLWSMLEHFNLAAAGIEGKIMRLSSLPECIESQAEQAHTLQLSFRILGKFITAPESKTLPLMQIELMTVTKEIVAAFGELVNKFVKINAQAPLHQQRNCLLFFNAHRPIIFGLTKLAGISALKMMNASLGNSVLPLERMLLNIPKGIFTAFNGTLIEALAEYVKPYPSSSMQMVIDCLLALNCLIVVNASGDKEPVEFYMKMAKNCSPEVFLKELVSMLCRILFKDKGPEITQQIVAKIFKRISPEQLVALVSAMNAMQNDPYREVFSHLLWLDITAGSINHFLHNTKQENLIGKSLAMHNQAIRDQLQQHGIKPEAALDYSKICHFIVAPTDQNYRIDNQYSVLWGYLKQLKKSLDAHQPDASNQVDLLKNTVNSFINEMNQRLKLQDNSRAAMIKLLTKELDSKLIKIGKQCKACLHEKQRREQKEALPFNNLIYEFAQHFTDQLTLIQTETAHAKKILPKTDEKKAASAVKMFSVEQWRKDKVMTFFLGNEVGCCLAVNGAQFSAMVQRRMDDAMLFHVAVDKSTGRAAGLIWLYLAETQDKKIVLIANFFEVNVKFGLDTDLRQAILNCLLQFTQQYLQDNPGITGFYMNQLHYGHNVGDLDSYPLVSLQVKDKLGGPYIPHESIMPYENIEDKSEVKSRDQECLDELSPGQKKTTTEMYYLTSLGSSHFHLFDPVILSQQASPIVQPLAALIQTKVVEFSQTERDQSKIIQRLIKEYGIELEAFYEQPLASNQSLINMIDAALKSSMSLQKPSRISVRPAIADYATLFAYSRSQHRRGEEILRTHCTFTPRK